MRSVPDRIADYSWGHEHERTDAAAAVPAPDPPLLAGSGALRAARGEPADAAPRRRPAARARLHRRRGPRRRRRLPAARRWLAPAAAARGRGGRRDRRRAAHRRGGRGRRDGRLVGAGALQGAVAHAAAAAPPDGRGRQPDRVARPVGGGAGLRRRGAHHPRPGLPRQRAAPLRLHRARGRGDPPPGRAAAPGLARTPVVPRRLGPRPDGLAQLPPRPDRRPGAHRAAVPAARAAGRGRARLRAAGHPPDAPAVRRTRAGRDAADDLAAAGRALGHRHRRTATAACWR